MNVIHIMGLPDCVVKEPFAQTFSVDITATVLPASPVILSDFVKTSTNVIDDLVRQDSAVKTLLA